MVPIPEASAQAIALEQARTWLWLLEGGWGIAILLLLCLTGLSARMRDLATRASPKSWLAAIAIYGALLAIFVSAGSLPISWLKVLVRKEFGLEHLTAAAWAGREVTRIAFNVALAAGCLWIPYMLIRRAGKRAWFLAWLGIAAFMLAMKVAGPLLIDPIVEPAGPLNNVVLEQKLQALARQAGMDEVRIVVDGETAKSNAISADVRGLGPAVRIRLSEALASSSVDQLRFVVAHELGHHVLGHLWQDTALALAILLASLLAAQEIGERLSQRLAPRLGFGTVSDMASAPLLLALLAVASAMGGPLENALARQEEHEADVFALELTRNNRAAAETLMKAQYTNLLNPRPHWLIHALRHGHPPLAERIEFANTYRPWETGEPLRYGALLRSAEGVGRSSLVRERSTPKAPSSPGPSSDSFRT